MIIGCYGSDSGVMIDFLIVPTDNHSHPRHLHQATRTLLVAKQMFGCEGHMLKEEILGTFPERSTGFMAITDDSLPS